MNAIVYMDNHSDSYGLKSGMLRADWYFWLWIALWTFTVLGIFIMTIPSIGQTARQLATTEAWGHLRKDPFLCLTEPILNEEDCLTYEGFQGYKEGDVRVAANISAPLGSYLTFRTYDGVFDISY